MHLVQYICKHTRRSIQTVCLCVDQFVCLPTCESLSVCLPAYLQAYACQRFQIAASFSAGSCGTTKNGTENSFRVTFDGYKTSRLTPTFHRHVIKAFFSATLDAVQRYVLSNRRSKSGDDFHVQRQSCTLRYISFHTLRRHAAFLTELAPLPSRRLNSFSFHECFFLKGSFSDARFTWWMAAWGGCSLFTVLNQLRRGLQLHWQRERNSSGDKNTWSTEKTGLLLSSYFGDTDDADKPFFSWGKHFAL